MIWTPESGEVSAQFASKLDRADAELKPTVSGLSKGTVLKILKQDGMHKVKRTVKPGLAPKMKKDRLAFALKYKDWTLDDWKSVCFSDETSVVLGHRRGADKVWRTKEEAYDPTVMKRRWKGYSEFMFWGCFSYNFKGPCHVWVKETAAERKKAQKEIDQLNAEREADCKTQWELETGTKRINLDRPGKAPGKAPTWKFTKVNGKLERCKGAGGVDWWRYRTQILKAKMIPFAVKHGLVIQQDNAPSHREKYNQELLQRCGFEVMNWCGNSPDLNAVEPAWYWMKKESIKYRDWEYK